MNIVSLEQTPDFIDAIDGRIDLGQAFLEAQNAILNPDIQAAVIVRGSQTLEESKTALIRAFDLKQEHPIRLDSLEVCPIPLQQTFFEVYRDPHNPQETIFSFQNKFGPDLADIFMISCQTIAGLDGWEIRGRNSMNFRVPWHMDRPYNLFHDNEYEGMNTPKTLDMQGSLAFTFATHGGGVIFQQVFRRELPVDISIANSRLDYIANSECDLDTGKNDRWQVAEGDIAVLRCNDWPRAFMPSYHAPPSGISHGPDVRVSCVGRATTPDVHYSSIEKH